MGIRVDDAWQRQLERLEARQRPARLEVEHLFLLDVHLEDAVHRLDERPHRLESSSETSREALEAAEGGGSPAWRAAR